MVTRKTSRIMVVGAGLAGAACARALARAGVSVVLVEAGPAPAMGASGNPVGILHPFVSRDHNLASQWFAAGMQTSLRWCHALAQQDAMTDLFGTCGVLQLAASEEESANWSGLAQRFGFEKSWLEFWDANQVADFISGQTSQESRTRFGGLWCAQGTWVRPAVFVARCLADAKAHGAQIIFNHRIESPESLARELDGHFDGVVLCAAQDIHRLAPSATLRLNAVRGAITAFRPPQATHQVAHQSAHQAGHQSVHQAEHQAAVPFEGPSAIICLNGYVTPLIDGELIVGATFERLTEASEFGSRDVQAAAEENLARLEAISPALAAQCQTEASTSRVSVRSATHDRMPLIGRIADPSAPLSVQLSQLAQMPRDPRVFVLGGLGSRGLATAPLGAEIITAMITGQPLPVSVALINSVDPARFALRAHQRRNLQKPAVID